MNIVTEGLGEKSEVRDLEVPVSLKLEAENGLGSWWIKKSRKIGNNPERRMMKRDVSWRAADFVPKCL